jgi:ElaB/YqjD/DUF883 family membrane-anchored ribosome-binding protein
MNSTQNRRTQGDTKRPNFQKKTNGPTVAKTGFDAGNTTNSNDKQIAKRSGSSATSSTDWIESFSAPVSTAERRVQSVLTEQPLMTVGIALGAGLAGGLILKKKFADGNQTGSPDGMGDVASFVSAGFLTQGLSATLGRFQDEMDRLKVDSIADVKEGFLETVKQDLSEKPFETIATAVGIGFGLANLDLTQFKRGALRVVKLLAVRSLDEVGSKQLGVEGDTYGQA